MFTTYIGDEHFVFSTTVVIFNLESSETSKTTHESVVSVLGNLKRIWFLIVTMVTNTLIDNKESYQVT